MTVATVRILCGDKAIYERDTTVADGKMVDFILHNNPVASVKVYVDGTLKTLTADYTVDLDLGLVTFGTAPVSGKAVSITYTHTLMSDTDISALLVLESNDNRLAAADALDTIASSQSMIDKKIKMMDISTDGPAVAADLRKHAASLRALARAEEDATSAGFDIAEMVVDDFSFREKIWNDALEEGIV